MYTVTIGTCVHHRFVPYSSIQRLILASEQQIYCGFCFLNGVKAAIVQLRTAQYWLPYSLRSIVNHYTCSISELQISHNTGQISRKFFSKSTGEAVNIAELIQQLTYHSTELFSYLLLQVGILGKYRHFFKIAGENCRRKTAPTIIIISYYLKY